MPKKTRWFPASVKPVRRGWYETDIATYSESLDEFRVYWTGKRWDSIIFPWHGDRWRGLTAPVKG